MEREETNIGAHAILISPSGKIILQQRDEKPGLINSGLISMFGGTIKLKETLVEGLIRELNEELDIDVAQKKIEKIGTYEKTKNIDGIDWVVNVFTIRHVELDEVALQEGKSIYFVHPGVAIKNSKLTRVTKLALEDYMESISAGD